MNNNRFVNDPKLVQRASTLSKQCLQAVSVPPDVVHLNMSKFYGQSWTQRDGVRELLQNYFDGLARVAVALDLAPIIRHQYVLDGQSDDDPDHLRINSWLRVGGSDRDESSSRWLLLGQICSDLEDGNKPQLKISLINRYTSLQPEILRLGTTNKASSKVFAGRFGDGMKLGVLALVRDRIRVQHYTAGFCWNWKMIDDELRVQIRRDKNVLSDNSDNAAVDWQHGRGDTCVTISAVDRGLDELLLLQHYPAISETFCDDETRAATVVPLDHHLSVFDVRQAHLLLDDLYSGGLYVSLIFVATYLPLLANFGFSDPKLRDNLSSDRSMANNRDISAAFSRRVRAALPKMLPSTFDSVYDLVANAADADGNTFDTIWRSLLEWGGASGPWKCKFVDIFRQRHGGAAYPHALPLQMEIIERDLGRAAIKVSQCLYDVLTSNPEESGFWPLGDAVKHEFVSSASVPIRPALLAKIDRFMRSLWREADVQSLQPHTSAARFITARDTHINCQVFLLKDRGQKAQICIAQSLLSQCEEQQQMLHEHNQIDQRMSPTMHLLLLLMPLVVEQLPSHKKIDMATQMRLHNLVFDIDRNNSDNNNQIAVEAPLNAKMLPIADDNSDDSSDDDNSANTSDDGVSKSYAQEERDVSSDDNQPTNRASWSEEFDDGGNEFAQYSEPDVDRPVNDDGVYAKSNSSNRSVSRRSSIDSVDGGFYIKGYSSLARVMEKFDALKRVKKPALECDSRVSATGKRRQNDDDEAASHSAEQAEVDVAMTAAAQKKPPGVSKKRKLAEKAVGASKRRSLRAGKGLAAKRAPVTRTLATVVDDWHEQLRRAVQYNLGRGERPITVADCIVAIESFPYFDVMHRNCNLLSVCYNGRNAQFRQLFEFLMGRAEQDGCTSGTIDMYRDLPVSASWTSASCCETTENDYTLPTWQ